MKKQIAVLIIFLSLMLCTIVFADDSWTCINCGSKVPEQLGDICPNCFAKREHQWKEATCTEPKTCSICGATEGEALGHDWKEATIFAPKTCSRCQETEGKKVDVKVDSIINFGHYEQDNNLDNGPEPIEWIVLDVQDSKALLLSKYGLNAKPYNTEFVNVTWETCTLRSWLNDDFLNEAFNAEEQSTILTITVDNSINQGYKEWDTSGGNNTQDKIFLLSYAEANQYLGVTNGGSNNLKSRVNPTAYAIAQGAIVSKDNASAFWWLRSPGPDQIHVAHVIPYGSLYYDAAGWGDNVVRPAFWLNLESDIF